MAPQETEVKNELQEQTEEMNAAANAAKKELGLEIEEEGAKEATSEEKTEEEKAAEAQAAEDTKKAEEAKQAEEKKKEEESKKVEEDKLLATDDKDLDDAKKYQKLQLLKVREDEKKKQEETVLTAFAKERNISIDEARKELEHVGKISEKYAGDVKKLAEAYLHIQRAYTKSQDELKKLQDAAPIKSIENISDDDIIKNVIDAGTIKVKGKSLTREEIVQAYKDSHQKQTENVNDDAVLYMVANEIRQNVIGKRKEGLAEVKTKAEKKRTELINSIPEADKEFIEEVKAVLDNHADEAVMSESFSLTDIINWAKGKRYDGVTKKAQDDIKKAYDDGYKKGKEEAKILGTRGAIPPKAPGSSKPVTLTEAQKKEALDMFRSLDVSDEDKFKLYVDTVPEARRAK